MADDFAVNRFDIRMVSPAWSGQDLAEVLVVYLSGYKSKVYTDGATPNRWQLGDGNNVWLHRDGEQFWVNFRYPWAREAIGAVAVLLKKLYGLEVIWQ